MKTSLTNLTQNRKNITNVYMLKCCRNTIMLLIIASFAIKTYNLLFY